MDWPALHAGARRLRVALPTYPFQRERYWVEPSPPVPGVQTPGYQEKVVPEGTTPPPRPLQGSIVPGSQGFEPLAGGRLRPRPALGTAYVPPSNDLEQRIAGLFEDLLGIAPVGALDQFFEMGGNSLLGLQLLSRMKSDLGAEVRLEWLFEASSVADLAELVRLIEEEKASRTTRTQRTSFPGSRATATCRSPSPRSGSGSSTASIRGGPPST